MKALAFDGTELVGFAVSGSFLHERQDLKNDMANWI